MPLERDSLVKKLKAVIFSEAQYQMLDALCRARKERG